MPELPADKAFEKYLEEAIGPENARIAFSAFGMPPSVSARMNPFKVPEGGMPPGRPVPWSEYGILMDFRPNFTLDPVFHAGGYYVQDSSAMFAGHVFRQALSRRISETGPGHLLKVLDLCAAPGGKTTDMAASLRLAAGDGFILAANEVVRQRAGILADNTAIWGDPNVVVTSADPEDFGKLPGYFDIIAADVPCSGEGMFRKDGKAAAQWSEANVALCQARQRRIIADAWASLAEGGILIYSTCTFNRYENDLNVKWICDNLGAVPIFGETDGEMLYPGIIGTGCGFLLVPGLVPGEGQYCSAVIKSGGTVGRIKSGSRKPAGTASGRLKDMIPPGLFTRAARLYDDGQTVRAVPEAIADEAEIIGTNVRTLSSGCTAGAIKGRDFIPSADLALSLLMSDGAWPQAEADLDTALKFLHRDPIRPECGKGYVCLTYRGLKLGFIKNIGDRCNNLHPQGRRIRMDI